MTGDVYICDAVRTPIGRYGGALASVGADELAAVPVAELCRWRLNLPLTALDEVVLGCANQAGSGQQERGPHGVIASRVREGIGRA